MSQLEQGGEASAVVHVPLCFQRLIPGQQTLVLDLVKCLYIPKDYNGTISFSVSDVPPGVHHGQTLREIPLSAEPIQ